MKLRTSEKIAIAELRSNISFKSCGIAIAEVLPSSCRIAIEDSKKVARAHHCCSHRAWPETNQSPQAAPVGTELWSQLGRLRRQCCQIPASLDSYFK
jgi:hypothetical protein